MRWFDDHDELYWNVTGNDWPVPIESASASIDFPANASGNMRAQAFTGFYGSRARMRRRANQRQYRGVESTERLAMHEGLTVDVDITKGVLTGPAR